MQTIKKIIGLTLFMLLLSFAVSLPAYAADTPQFVSEGSVGNTTTASMAWIGFDIMGMCDDGSTIPPATSTNYVVGSAADIASAPFGGLPCPKNAAYSHSAIAGLSNVALAIYTNPPASTRAFAMDLGQTLGFVPHQVAAQGIGFSGLSALLPIWKAFRNVSYALLTIVLIVIGFMVMFRKKIDPKTVVTVQNAIPRVIIALLLVTFSYAIVGLVIDLMYFSIVLAANLIVPEVNAVSTNSFGFLVGSNFGRECTWTWAPTLTNLLQTILPTCTYPPMSASNMTGILLNGGLWGFMRMFFGSGLQSINDIGRLLSFNYNPTAVIAETVIPGIAGFLAGGAKAAALTNGPVLLFLVVAIVLLFGVVRLIFLLVDAYINIMISLIFSPFQLMMEAIPGTNSFSGWFRWLIAKVITFPVTAVLLMVSALLTAGDNANKLWGPPLLSTGGGAAGISGFVGLGLLLVIPDVVGSIQKAIKAEPFIPGGVGAVFGPLGAGVGQAFQLFYQYSFISSGIRHKPDNRSPVQTLREGAGKGFSSVTGGGEGGH